MLPSIDPRNYIRKDCQDSCFFVHSAVSLLAGVFDGHGSEGLSVSSFAGRFMSSFFLQNPEFFIETPTQAIQDMFWQCQSALTAQHIDCSLSGTTAVVAFIHNNTIWTGCAGDSRAVLATLSPTDNSTAELTVHNPFARKILANRAVYALPLTIDNKPDLPGEFERIVKSGGRVKQLTNEFGVKVGPFRVWKQLENLPGLAMSRSIGDEIAKTLGVICAPVLHSHRLTAKDLFLVLASDGVWTVMSSSDAVLFVEKFRQKCCTVPLQGNYPVSAAGVPIAHLLAEETRYRWFGLCEEDDVSIDDISAIVIDFQPPELYPTQP